MYTYKIACRNNPVPTFNIGYKTLDLQNNIHYYNADMTNFSKNYKSPTKNKKQYLTQKSREWLTDRLNKLMLNTSCLNTKIQEKSRHAKSLIDNECNNFLWDRAKILVNPYELIYFNTKKHTDKPGHVAAIEPLSRSFFKMIELSNTELYPLIHQHTPLRSLHLAEGPGGFIEAIIYLRKTYISDDNYSDIHYGITLIDPANEIPSWKRSCEFLQEHHNVHILTGADGTGDLYSIDNLKYLAQRFKYNKVDLVTADGGFDFSVGGYNTQEHMASKLIFAEIIGAMCVLQHMGTFICKFFDMNSRVTADMLYLLQCHFHEIKIIKPKTSRLANSEKYIVCHGFKTCHILPQLLDILHIWNICDSDNQNIIEKITNTINNNTINNNTANLRGSLVLKTIDCLFKLTPSDTLPDIHTMAPISFYKYISGICDKMTSLQVDNINKTLQVINERLFSNQHWLDDNHHQQILNARNWCREHIIPYY